MDLGEGELVFFRDLTLEKSMFHYLSMHPMTALNGSVGFKERTQELERG